MQLSDEAMQVTIKRVSDRTLKKMLMPSWYDYENAELCDLILCLQRFNDSLPEVTGAYKWY